jgi:hypothetical protein
MFILAAIFFLGALATYYIGKKELDKDTNSSLIVIGFGFVFVILSIVMLAGGSQCAGLF